MKKKYLIFAIAMFLFLPQVVMAAPNATISTNESSIEKGKSVTATVTLTDTAAWNIKITGSGAATCSQKLADVTSDGKSTTKYFTLSCASTSEGKITFSVTGDITSGSGETKDISLTKEVTVTRAKSSDNTLSDLKVDGATVPNFSSNNTSYTLKDNSGNSINISATPRDGKASVSGTGNKTLNYGRNSFDITVTAENGSRKTYNIVVNKPDPRSTNNNLKSLTVDKGTISFNKNTTSYLVKVEHSVNDITVSATVEDGKASVSGTGKKTLKDYENEFSIVVKAENGATKTYIVKVVRKDASGNYGVLSKDNTVKSITVKGYDIKFNKDTKKYNVLVENTNEVEITVVPNDSKAMIAIQNNKDLKAGLNKVVVQVTAENGDVNEYFFNVYKIGEETKQEETIVAPEKKDNNPTNKSKEDNSSILEIVAGIEFIVIGVLLILLLKKRIQMNKLMDEKTISNPINNLKKKKKD